MIFHRFDHAAHIPTETLLHDQPIEAKSLSRINFSAVLIDTLNASMHRV
jgi:hypothetical protein